MSILHRKFRPGPITACLSILFGLLLLFWGCMPKFPPAPPGLFAAFAELPGNLRLEFPTDQGRQVAYYLPPLTDPASQPARLAILYPGIGSVALGWLRFIGPEEAPDTGWLMIDYPGRGESAGKMDPDELYRNSEGALTALAAHFGVTHLSSDLALLGHSFGSGAALQFAARHPTQVKRIVLVAPFDTLRRAVALKSWLLALILPSQIDNRELLRALLHGPNPPVITILHSTSDQTLPVRMGRNLRDVAPDRITYREFPDDSHVGILTTRHDLILDALTGRRP
jgi:pimeloyl-ACP methyl ester carboxylesterase